MNPTTIKGEHNLPVGKYHAVWSGWQVKIGNVTYELTGGIRGTMPAIVTVGADGVATVNTK